MVIVKDIIGAILCLVGRHKWVQSFTSGLPLAQHCLRCGYPGQLAHRKEDTD